MDASYIAQGESGSATSEIDGGLFLTAAVVGAGRRSGGSGDEDTDAAAGAAAVLRGLEFSEPSSMEYSES